MISLNVQFQRGFNFVGPKIVEVNHAMFYVIDHKNNTMHRVHCKPDDMDKYHVECSEPKYSSPQDPNGEGFQISLTPIVHELSGKKLAEMLGQLPPPPYREGGCQWWILKNIIKLEESGHVKHGTLRKILHDSRMDSSRLMEFQELRDELHFLSLLKSLEKSIFYEMALDA